jgi:hypothetical protein
MDSTSRPAAAHEFSARFACAHARPDEEECEATGSFGVGDRNRNRRGLQMEVRPAVSDTCTYSTVLHLGPNLLQYLSTIILCSESILQWARYVAWFRAVQVDSNIAREYEHKRRTLMERDRETGVAGHPLGVDTAGGFINGWPARGPCSRAIIICIDTVLTYYLQPATSC